MCKCVIILVLRGILYKEKSLSSATNTERLSIKYYFLEFMYATRTVTTNDIIPSTTLNIAQTARIVVSCILLTTLRSLSYYQYDGLFSYIRIITYLGYRFQKLFFRQKTLPYFKTIIYKSKVITMYYTLDCVDGTIVECVRFSKEIRQKYGLKNNKAIL